MNTLDAIAPESAFRTAFTAKVAAFTTKVPKNAPEIELLEAIARLVALLDKYAAQWRRRSSSSSTLNRLLALRRVFVEVVLLSDGGLMGKHILVFCLKNIDWVKDVVKNLRNPADHTDDLISATYDVVGDRNAFKNDMLVLFDTSMILTTVEDVFDTLLGTTPTQLAERLDQARAAIAASAVDSAIMEGGSASADSDK
jgi:hypothetical protein